MTDIAISVETVVKRFTGRPVVDRLSFEVRHGEVFALLGPNGAGKTTVVRMLVGIIRPDQGSIAISLDGSTTSTLHPERSGYLPEDRGLYRDIPVLRTLVYFGQLRGLQRSVATTRAHEWLERVNLLDRKDERLDALSKGNQQRVQLIAAVIHGPELTILDEPSTGLHPLSQEFFLDLVRDLKQSGTTILLSAHQMDLVERVADRVLLMNRGHEILTGSMTQLQNQLDDRSRVRLTMPMLPVIPVVMAIAVFRDPDSIVSRFLALFPLTSAPAMPARLVLSDPGIVEFMVSVTLLMGAIWLTRRIAGRIFEVGMLLYGKEPTWREIAKWVKQPSSR